MIDRTTETKARYILIALCIFLGFLQGWSSRTAIVNDTVSYLDIGDFIWHGHWSLAINGLWNPLYSAILGAADGIVRPSYKWEYPLVHLVVFLIFLFALACFDFFLKQLISLRREWESVEECSIPVWVWTCIGYVLFFWSSLQLIGVSETNPDMLVAAFVFLAAGLLVRIRRSSASPTFFCLLGLVLGLGYLTKSIMFPVSLMFLAIAFVIGRPQWRRALISVAVFLVVAGPYIIGLSVAKGHLTYGDSGSYNYAVHVDNLPRVHWQGTEANSTDDGQPLHPSRQLLSRPATFEFGGPIGGTYPVWTDPTYWYVGLRPHVSLRRTVIIEVRLLAGEFEVLLGAMHGALVAGIFVLLYASGRRWFILADIARYWFLILPCITTLALYAMIHIEPRYLGPFLVTMVIALFVSVRLPVSSSGPSLASAIAVLMVVMYFLPIESPSLGVHGFVRDALGRSQIDPDSPAEVVKAMYDLGLHPGDNIASLQWSLYGNSTWARLAKVRIVSEVYYWPERPETARDDFWTADSAVQEQVIHALAASGARFIVSELPPPANVDSSAWQRLGDSHYYAYRVQSFADLSIQK